MPSGDRPALTRAATYLPVRDLERSAAHYEHAFGFTREYAGGDPVSFVIMSRDGLPIMLRTVADDVRIVPNEAQGGTWDVFFWVTNLPALHAELSERGATIVYGPIVQPYGVNEFAVRDLDGHVLGFGESM